MYTLKVDVCDLSMNTFTLIVNAGRSGSTYLSKLLQSCHTQICYVAHEDIPVQISQPRRYNRAYDPQRYQQVMADERLSPYLEKWKTILQTTSIIETGWTSYHLMPVLSQVFGRHFQYVILHRHPMQVACSRAAMGNFHADTYYDDAHEVSPMDTFSIASHYQSRWGKMNHFEKCLYWWYIIYLEAYEFQYLCPDVAHCEITAIDLFSGEALPGLFQFLGVDPPAIPLKGLSRNALPQFMRESFPLEDEWKAFRTHPEIIEFAQDMGYQFDEQQLQIEAQKYQQLKGLLPRLRQHTRYWKFRLWLKQKLGL